MVLTGGRWVPVRTSDQWRREGINHQGDGEEEALTWSWDRDCTKTAGGEWEASTSVCKRS